MNFIGFLLRKELSKNLRLRIQGVQLIGFSCNWYLVGVISNWVEIGFLEMDIIGNWLKFFLDNWFDNWFYNKLCHTNTTHFTYT